MKDRDGNEWRMVPVKATDEMIAEMLAAKDFDSIWPAAIAAAPQLVAGEVTDDVAARVLTHFSNFPVRLSNAQNGRDMIAAVQSELGPALGMTAWREPTEEECVKMCSILTDWEVRRNDGFSLSPQGITQAQEAHGRAIFEAVREVIAEPTPALVKRLKYLARRGDLPGACKIGSRWFCDLAAFDRHIAPAADPAPPAASLADLVARARAERSA